MRRISRGPRWRTGSIAGVLAMAASIVLATAGAGSAKTVCWTQGSTQFVSAMHYCVSSVLAPQGSTTYGPRNLADGNSTTAWCEGAGGSGVGQSVTIRVDEGPAFRRLLIGNGYAKSRRSFARNGRVKLSGSRPMPASRRRSTSSISPTRCPSISRNRRGAGCG